MLIGRGVFDRAQIILGAGAHHELRGVPLTDGGRESHKIAAVEKWISPFCKHIGFRTDLALHTVLEGTCLMVVSKKKVNPLRFWHLVECVNSKNGHQPVFTNGYALNGHS